MFKAPFVVLLALGLTLLVYAFKSTDSASSKINRAVTGSPTNESLLLFAMGGTGVVAGGLGLLLGPRA
jgi:hypothetical protein